MSGLESIEGLRSTGSLIKIIEVLRSDESLAKQRLIVGKQLLKLLNANVFVSYVCGPKGPFLDPVDINLGQDFLEAYEAHFINVDGITPRLFHRRGTNRIDPPLNSKDEFVHDFLHQRHMHHGMNFFAKFPSIGNVDLRIWRDSSAGAFSDEDVRLLDSIGGLSEKLWRSPVDEKVQLTNREKQVTELVSEGFSDKQICTRLEIALPTLRTHLKNVFGKVGVDNRSSLTAYYLQHHRH